VLKKAII